MEIVVKPAMTVLSYQTRTTMSALMGVTQEVGGLYREAAKHNMHVCGCNYWIYRGCSGDMNEEFELEIVLPVLPDKSQPEKYVLKTIPAYRCVTYTHHGAWDDFKTIYPKLMQQMAEQGLEFAGSSREMYLHCDFLLPQNSITEIQIEVR